MAFGKFDPSMLSIVPESYAQHGGQLRTGSKYDSIFKELPENVRLRAPAEAVDAISGALAKYLKRKGKSVRVRIVRECNDGMGGIWWFHKDGHQTTNKRGK